MSEWIPVKDGLPVDGKWALWLFKDGSMSKERYKSDAIDHFFPRQGKYDLEDAIAWMPLPPAYNPESKPDIYICSCGYGWDRSKVVRHHYCPNCGKKVEGGTQE